MIQLGGLVAVDVVPPVADEKPLVEHRSVRAQEGVVSAVLLTYVEDLALSFGISVVSRVLLAFAAKSSTWYSAVDWVVLTWCTPNGGPDLSVVSVVLAIIASMLLWGLRTLFRVCRRTDLWREVTWTMDTKRTTWTSWTGWLTCESILRGGVWSAEARISGRPSWTSMLLETREMCPWSGQPERPGSCSSMPGMSGVTRKFSCTLLPKGGSAQVRCLGLPKG